MTIKEFLKRKDRYNYKWSIYRKSNSKLVWKGLTADEIERLPNVEQYDIFTD